MSEEMLIPFTGFSYTLQSVPKESGDRHCTLPGLKGQDSSEMRGAGTGGKGLELGSP